MLQRSKWDFTPIELSLIEMRSWATTAERSVSSYARIDGGTRVTWKRQHEVFGTFASHWSAKLHFRRSSFGMVSTAHYVTSPMMSLQMDYFWRFFAWGFGASYGLRPELGFTRAPVGGGAKLPSSQATLQGAFLSGHWLINDTTAFEVTWDYEISQIAFDDTRTDRLFGLALVESQTRRQENLQTVMATMGFKKHL